MRTASPIPRLALFVLAFVLSDRKCIPPFCILGEEVPSLRPHDHHRHHPRAPTGVSRPWLRYLPKSLSHDGASLGEAIKHGERATMLILAAEVLLTSTSSSLYPRHEGSAAAPRQYHSASIFGFAIDVQLTCGSRSSQHSPPANLYDHDLYFDNEEDGRGSVGDVLLERTCPRSPSHATIIRESLRPLPLPKNEDQHDDPFAVASAWLSEHAEELLSTNSRFLVTTVPVLLAFPISSSPSFPLSKVFKVAQSLSSAINLQAHVPSSAVLFDMVSSEEMTFFLREQRLRVLNAMATRRLLAMANPLNEDLADTQRLSSNGSSVEAIHFGDDIIEMVLRTAGNSLETAEAEGGEPLADERWEIAPLTDVGVGQAFSLLLHRHCRHPTSPQQSPTTDPHHAETTCQMPCLPRGWRQAGNAGFVNFRYRSPTASDTLSTAARKSDDSLGSTTRNSTNGTETIVSDASGSEGDSESSSLGELVLQVGVTATAETEISHYCDTDKNSSLLTDLRSRARCQKWIMRNEVDATGLERLSQTLVVGTGDQAQCRRLIQDNLLLPSLSDEGANPLPAGGESLHRILSDLEIFPEARSDNCAHGGRCENEESTTIGAIVDIKKLRDAAKSVCGAEVQVESNTVFGPAASPVTFAMPSGKAMPVTNANHDICFRASLVDAIVSKTSGRPQDSGQLLLTSNTPSDARRRWLEILVDQAAERDLSRTVFDLGPSFYKQQATLLSPPQEVSDLERQKGTSNSA